MKKLLFLIMLLFICPIICIGCKNNDQKSEINSFSMNEGVLTIYGGGTLTNFWGDVSESVTEIKFSANSNFSTISKNTFKNYTKLNKIEIPASITKIELDVFKGCNKLNQVNYLGSASSWSQINFANNYSTPGCYASKFLFNGEELKFLNLNNHISEIKQYAFYNFKNLEKITVSCDKISQYAFYNCSNVNTIHLSALSKIDYSAFYNCGNLEDVYFVGDVSNWLNINFENTWSNPLTYAQNLYFNNCLVENITIINCKTIPQYVFTNYKGLKEVSLDNNVVNIGKSAFYNCINADIKIPVDNKIENYYANCFANCKSVKNLIFNSSLKYIGDGAFINCYDSTIINIPNSTYYIGKEAFAGAKNVITCSLPFIGNQLDSEDKESLLFGSIFGTTPQEGCVSVTQGYGYAGASLRKCYIPNTIRSVKITNQISKISSGAFSGCTMLNSVYIPKSVLLIENDIFRGYNLTEFYYEGNVDEWATINFTTPIFKGTSLASTTILYCNNVKIDCIEFQNVKNIHKYAFCGVKGLKQVKFSSNLEHIGEEAFGLCTELMSVDFSNCSNLYAISTYAFYRCNNLLEVNLSSCIKLQSLSTSLFSNCQNLSSITIPSSIKRIEGYAFYSCPNLTNFNCNTEYDLEYVGAHAFAYCNKIKNIYLKDIRSAEDTSFRDSNIDLIIYTNSSILINYYVGDNITAGIKRNYTYQDYLKEK